MALYRLDFEDGQPVTTFAGDFLSRHARTAKEHAERLHEEGETRAIQLSRITDSGRVVPTSVKRPDQRWQLLKADGTRAQTGRARRARTA